MSALLNLGCFSVCLPVGPSWGAVISNELEREAPPKVISAITFLGCATNSAKLVPINSPIPPFSLALLGLRGVSRLSVLFGPDPPIAALAPFPSLQKSPEGAGQCYVSLAFPQTVRTSPRFHFPPLYRPGLAQSLATLLTANLTCRKTTFNLCKQSPGLERRSCNTPEKNHPQLLDFFL